MDEHYLKPCPFCAAEVEVKRVRIGKWAIVHNEDNACPLGRGTPFFEASKWAMQLWNRRDRFKGVKNGKH